jgi:hypothetical protein
VAVYRLLRGSFEIAVKRGIVTRSPMDGLAASERPKQRNNRTVRVLDSVQLPRFAVHSWLVGDEAHEGAWTRMDIGLLVGLLGAFENRDPSLLVGARFDEDGDIAPSSSPAASARAFSSTAGSPGHRSKTARDSSVPARRSQRWPETAGSRSRKLSPSFGSGSGSGRWNSSRVGRNVPRNSSESRRCLVAP